MNKKHPVVLPRKGKTAGALLDAAGCEMKLVCPKQWDQLEVTDEEGIRSCQQCKCAVFHTRTPAELRLAASRGLCVHIAPELRSRLDPGLIAKQFDVTRESIRAIEARVRANPKATVLGMPIIRTNTRKAD